MKWFAGPLLFTGLLGAAVWMSWLVIDKTATARAAADNLDACQKLVVQLRELQRRPAIAVSKALDSTSISVQLEQLVRELALPDTALQNITPRAPARVGDNPYRTHSLDVSLQRVTMAELVRLLLKLTDAESGLTVSSIRLAPASESGNSSEQWHASSS